VTIKPPLAGQPISSSQWLQPVAAAVNRLEQAKGAGQQSPGAPTSADAAGVESGALVAEQANTITVTRDQDGALVTVAKPPNLRGDIGTRINGDGDTEEIFRAYHPGDVILMAAVFNTGIADVPLADLNWAARRWTIEV
jgi:hypothetical protein